MVEDGFVEYILPQDPDKILDYWKWFLKDHGSWHPLASMSQQRLKRTVPVVLYGDEGSSRSGHNGFMLGTWRLGGEIYKAFVFLSEYVHGKTGPLNI